MDKQLMLDWSGGPETWPQRRDALNEQFRSLVSEDELSKTEYGAVGALCGRLRRARQDLAHDFELTETEQTRAHALCSLLDSYLARKPAWAATDPKVRSYMRRTADTFIAAQRASQVPDEIALVESLGCISWFIEERAEEIASHHPIVDTVVRQMTGGLETLVERSKSAAVEFSRSAIAATEKLDDKIAEARVVMAQIDKAREELERAREQAASAKPWTWKPR